MNTFLLWLKVIGFIMVFLLILAAIWLIPLFYGWDDLMPMMSLIIQLLLSTIVLLITAFLLYINGRFKKWHLFTASEADENPENVPANDGQLSFALNEKQCFQYLKALFKQWGHHKKQFLRQAPWYLVVGQAASGKSSLLNYSGLDLLAKDNFDNATQQLLGTQFGISYPHTWRFGRSAVFLELPFSSDATLASLFKVC
jgi:type VI secretion system protein ImpL